MCPARKRSLKGTTETILDSGANRSTFTESTIQDNPHLVTYELRKGESTRHFIYGNGTQFSSDRAVLMGKYKVQLVTSEHSINLLSVRDIVIKGEHAVLFTPTAAIIRDIGGNYEVRFDKLISEDDDWFAPNNTLNLLSDLRDKHPLNRESLYTLEHGEVNYDTVKLNIHPQPTSRSHRHACSADEYVILTQPFEVACSIPTTRWDTCAKTACIEP